MYFTSFSVKKAALSTPLLLLCESQWAMLVPFLILKDSFTKGFTFFSSFPLLHETISRETNRIRPVICINLLILSWL
jgi:hypothetical protein